jgi:flagellar export protein FliJ
VKSPYHALLALKRAGEDAAGATLARAHRACQEAQAALALLVDRRATWMSPPPAAPAGFAGPAGHASVVAELERAERWSRRDLADAEQALEAARQEYRERRREREVVERLHQDWLARAEALAARRAQAELDDLAGRSRGADLAAPR